MPAISSFAKWQCLHGKSTLLVFSKDSHPDESVPWTADLWLPEDPLVER